MDTLLTPGWRLFDWASGNLHGCDQRYLLLLCRSYWAVGIKTIRLVLAAFLSLLTTNSLIAAERPASVDLHAVEATVGQILEQDHYTQRKLDSNMAKQILETYLESLDFDKLYFTQEDIDQIRNKYSSGLGDDILLGNLTSAKNIYEIFKQRVDQRVAKIHELLTQRHNFSGNRTVTANRAKEPWPANASEADNVWRDWIEKELLEEKLSRSSTEPGPEVGRLPLSRIAESN
ncbi:MAG TPA: hypothetical protein VGH55_07785 [Chthoniobacterales bacterium]|jgi:6-pyruvoyl-tetrahydropterin synthase